MNIKNWRKKQDVDSADIVKWKQFEKLTPTLDFELEAYEDMLDYAFQEQDIRNIAITGLYGSGKSSLVRKYEYEKKLNFAYISLASFQTEQHIISSTEAQSTINLLEGKILNQLIHQTPKNKIPLTNFKLKKPIKRVEKVTISVILILVIAMLLELFYADKWGKLVNQIKNENVKQVLNLLITPDFRLVIVVTLFLIFGYVAYIMIDPIRKKNLLSKISAKEYNIEIFEDKDESYFDKYLNEVLYVFKNGGFDAVVFEDIDRFNEGGIYTRLREINRLANFPDSLGYKMNFLVKRRSKKRNRVVRFLYLLRDDMFKAEERTKLFDYIVPMVPVINRSNSLFKIEEMLEKHGLLGGIDKAYLHQVSLYIDDMRLLKNIVNETIAYRSLIGDKLDLDDNNLFAIIIYKNIFPYDFSQTLNDSGFVSEVFNNKSELFSSKIESYRKAIELMVKSLDNKKDEIKKLYSSRQQGNYDRQSYINRVREIQQDINELEHELRAYEEYIMYFERLSLTDLLDKVDDQDYFDKLGVRDEFDRFKEVKQHKCYELLKYFLRVGYINERYVNYINRHYEKGLHPVDQFFLKSLMNNSPLEFRYVLYNPSKVIEYINMDYYQRTAILNYDLINYIFSAECKKNTVSLIRMEIPDRIDGVDSIKDFFRGYFNLSPDQWSVEFVEISLRRFAQEISDILNPRFLDSEKLNTLMLIIVNRLTIKEIGNLNESDYISKNLSKLEFNPKYPVQSDKILSVMKAYCKKIDH